MLPEGVFDNVLMHIDMQKQARRSLVYHPCHAQGCTNMTNALEWTARRCLRLVWIGLEAINKTRTVVVVYYFFLSPPCTHLLPAPRESVGNGGGACEGLNELMLDWYQVGRRACVRGDKASCPSLLLVS